MGRREKAKLKIGKKLSIAILLLAGLITTYKIWLPLPATFLLVKDNIQQADCIVPTGWDDYFRLKKAVELYNQGYSKNILVSVVPERPEELREYDYFEIRVLGLKEISPREFALKAFKYFGKDSTGIYFTDLKITSTYDEAVAAKKFMKEKGFKSLILIGSTYSTRRARIIFKLVFRGTGIKIYHCTAKNALYNPSCWWRKERDVKAISQEYLSIAYNILYHFLLKKERTSFDTY